MSSELAAIECRGLGKAYVLAAHPAARLKQLLWHRGDAPVHWALRGVDLSVARGEVLGVVGTNGAGKSTLLQLLCGTLTPTEGSLTVSGRVAALLELGAGFNPEFSGRDNALLNAALLGLSPQQARDKLPEILEFADIGGFVDQPVKTYSSGMFVRLAFAVATSVEPDILIIDEALSVGDGAFARKSFDRIMRLRRAGATILFCSHSMYQVEALCERALWLDGGRVRALGEASEVCGAYQAHLNGLSGVGSDGLVGAHFAAGSEPGAGRGVEGRGTSEAGSGGDSEAGSGTGSGAGSAVVPAAATPPAGSGRITRMVLRCGEQAGAEVKVRSGRDDLVVELGFVSDPALPCPALALGISDANGLTVSSLLSLQDGARPTRHADGSGSARVVLPHMPLLKGRYSVTPFLLSEDGLHPYDQVLHAGHFTVTQDGPLQGIVSLPRRWE